MKNWTWINTQPDLEDQEWQQFFDRLRKAGIDAILPEVFNNHAAAYASEHLPVDGEWLEQILPLAVNTGLEIHAWVHIMTCNIPQVIETHPEWYAVNAAGESAAVNPAYVGYYKFLCPSRPEVAEFLRRRIVELAAYENLASIHLDYIRLPDVILATGLQPKYGIVQDREYPQYDYCYCEVCRSLFRNQTGTDPARLEDPSANPMWRQFRFDQITRLVKDHLAPAARNGGKQVSAAVFPNWQHVRQEWSKWELDAVLPMLYHNFYEEDLDWVGKQCAAGVMALEKRTPLYSGLFVPALKPDQMAEAVRISMANGARGVSLFAARSMENEHWRHFAQVVGEIKGRF